MLLLIGLLPSCNITSSLQSNENLLVKNKIVFKEKIKNASKFKEELQLLTFQKPNNKLFYIFPLRLSIYNTANDNKRETKFKWWLKNKLGEPPVVFKDPLVLASAKSMKNYLFNLGFLHNEVIPTLVIKKQKVKVIYTVLPNIQYKIDKIILPEGKDDISKIIGSIKKESLLKTKDAFNINTLDEERLRVANELRNRGYYFFNKEYISFDIDSLDKKKKLDLILNVKAPKDLKGQSKFKINDVYIYTDYSLTKNVEILELDTFMYDGYYFITKKNPFKPKALLFGVFFKKGDYYSLRNELKTQKKIVSFGAFKFVNIEYKLAKDSISLDAFLFLTPSKKQALSADIELSHSFEGLSGSVVSATYKNKNFTKRSDLLQLKISAGVELNLFNRNATSLLNTADVTAELSYYVNRFIVPFPLKKVSKNSNVKTKFSLIYNFEERIQRFSKHATTFTAGYEWNETQTKKHFYNPISATLLLIPKKDSIFQAQLDTLPSLQRSFEENIILGSTYTFLYTDKKGEEDVSYFKFQGDIYLAGNFIHAFAGMINANNTKKVPYKIFGKEYAMFARFEGNIVHYYKIGIHSEFVSRFNGGIAIPYGNSQVVPYFQQFFVGGANSVRAFRLRALGPGTYSNEKSFSNNNFFFDQSGDIKLEANLEYRFDLYKWFKFAFFLDAGNVWTLKDDPDRSGGAFRSDFYKAIAVGFGSGLRLDFTYFVIRADLAMPIVDPRFAPKERFRLTKKALGISQWSRNNLVFNLAIGYPF
ncbi:MAG: BamA/TamA family outer membrane protein [Chitinophagales bacterium]